MGARFVPMPIEAPVSATTLVLMRQLMPNSVDQAVGPLPDPTWRLLANQKSYRQKTRNHNPIAASLVA